VSLLEYRDTALRNERDVWAFTKLPTLATIGYFDDEMEKAAVKGGKLVRFPRKGGKPDKPAGQVSSKDKKAPMVADRV
jgi:hypothetical protein